MGQHSPRHAAPSPTDRFEPVLGFVAALLEPGLPLAGTVVLALTLTITVHVGVTGTFDPIAVLITIAILAAVVTVAVLALNRWQRRSTQ